MPRVNRVYEPDRAQLLHTFSHLSEGIIPEFWIRFGTNCGPLEHPVVREKFFEYFDRAFAYFRGIDLVDYAIQPNHIHLAILTNPAPIPLEEVARVQAELRDEVLNPKDPGDRKRLVEIEKDMHNYSLLMKQVTGPFGQWFMRELESKRDADIYCPVWCRRFGCTYLLSAKAAVQGMAYIEMNPLRHRPLGEPPVACYEAWTLMWGAKHERCEKGFKRLAQIIYHGYKVEEAERLLIRELERTVVRSIEETRRRRQEMIENGLDPNRPVTGCIDLNHPGGCPVFRRGLALGDFKDLDNFSRRHFGRSAQPDRVCVSVDGSGLCSLISPRGIGTERRC
jgi:hypothetical protein